MLYMTKRNLTTQRDYDDMGAEREPPAAGLEGLVGELHEKTNFRSSIKAKKGRPRHINESDEKEMKEVTKRAVGVGLREAEKIVLGHKDSLLEEINKLGLTRNDISKLVGMKHDYERRLCLGQALNDVTDEEFNPVMVQIMSEETGECTPLFSDRRRLRREKSNVTA